MDIEATFLGTATMLLRIGPFNLLTDPAFDPAGVICRFGFGTTSRRIEPCALGPEALPPIDAVLLSHDQHGDNLDRAGRGALSRAKTVLTTRSAAGRIPGAVGLAPFEDFTLERGGMALRIRATPARHGPPLSLPFVGSVVGFLIEWDGQQGGALYISGDTVPFRSLRTIREHARIGTAFLHMGGASFFSKHLRFTMNAREACEIARWLDAQWVVPVHFRGWTHFHDDASAIGGCFADGGLAERLVAWNPGDSLRWDERGCPSRVLASQPSARVARHA